MNINWKLRLQNKTTLTALVMALVALVYQVLGVCGVVPRVAQDQVTTSSAWSSTSCVCSESWLTRRPRVSATARGL